MKAPNFWKEKCDNFLNASVNEVWIHDEKFKHEEHISPMNINKEAQEAHI